MQNKVENIVHKLKERRGLEIILDQYADLNMYPVLGYEIEFYLPSTKSHSKQYCNLPHSHILDMHRSCINCLVLNENWYKNNLQNLEEELIVPIEKEKGINQYEISRGPFASITKLIESIDKTREALLLCGADLRSKPFQNDYGSSMHLHFNLTDREQNNIFDNKKILQNAANGICHFMNETLLAILPQENDYLRLDAKFMAPTHVCYGNNNRTTAVRIPDSKPSRLEYRVCSPMSDVYTSVFIILKSSLIGIKNEYGHYPQIFGNAYEDQYQLQQIATNIEAATTAFNPLFFLEE
jgi:glutamine synthetase